MTRLFKHSIVLVLTLFVAVACERAAPTATELTSGEPDELLGGLLGGSQVPGYTLVKEPLLPNLSELKISKLIGLEGGSLQLLGHTVQVPLGAVTKPTLFTLVVLPTGYVEVDLGATTLSLLGLIDVGSQGFGGKLVPVTLSYSRATNVSSANAPKLKVLRLNGLIGYRDFQVMPSQVNTTTRTVRTELDHFSRYAVAYPN